jgi:hypothetical protein
MIVVAYTGLIAGALACLIFAAICIRPALRLRTVTLRLSNHPTLRTIEAASDSLQAFAIAGSRLEDASHRFETAAVQINAAAASVGAYASQVAVMAVVVDSALELLVPRLRGMLE